MAKETLHFNQSDDDIITLPVVPETHLKINQNLCGKHLELQEGYAKVEFTTTDEMIVDELGLVHGGFTFGAADYAAMLAVNHPHVVLVGAQTRFLAPVTAGQSIIFEARATHTTTKKRDVIVMGFVNEIKIFEGTFSTVILEKHVLLLKPNQPI